jgi:hypothetical protein
MNKTRAKSKVERVDPNALERLEVKPLHLAASQ